MTTIVYRDGVMAADTRAYSGNKPPIGRKSKILQHNRELIGVSTRGVGVGPVVIDWYIAGMPGGPEALRAQLSLFDTAQGFQLLAARPGGEAIYMYDTALPVTVRAPYYAIGSGEEYALGALEMGATALEACLVACRLDVWSAEPIDLIGHDPDFAQQRRSRLTAAS